MAKRFLNGVDGTLASLANLPAGSVVYATSATRPTSRTDIVVIFIMATDPGSAALAGDLWLNTT